MINIISGISVTGVTIGTLALIVVLSVFNGFEELVKTLYNSFNPDLLITVKEGKTFSIADISREKISQIPGVISFTEVIEENALLKNRSEQYIVTLKGVSNDFLYLNPLDSMLVDGDFILQSNGADFAIMGYLVAYHLGIKINDFSDPLNVYIPRRTGKSFSVTEQPFNVKPIVPSAVFSVQQEMDSKYVIVPIGFAKEILDYTNERTSIEIRIAPYADPDEIQAQVKEIAGERFSVKNRFQQQELLYKIMKSEKWAIFFILTFIIIIAAFNVVGSLSMLILEKRKDIAVLHSLGADEGRIRKIFFHEGVLITLSGTLAGLTLGFVLCLMQLKFGLIKLGNDAGAFVIPYYPVRMQWQDFIAVFSIVMIIGFAAAWYPVRQISGKYLRNKISGFLKSQ